MHRLDLLDGHFVVAANLNLGAQFAQVLDEVIGKRVVVIEDEDHGLIVAVEERKGIAEVRGQIAEVKTHTPDSPGSGMQMRSNDVTSAI
jgi:uncharacterized protein YbjT (DUF2867 family)